MDEGEGISNKNVIARSDVGATKQSLEITLALTRLLRHPSGVPRNDDIEK